MKLVKHFAPNLGMILIISLFLLVQSAAGSLPAPAALSQAPSATLISYQGRLADAGGNPLTGDYQMRFALYGVPAGGSACWSETQTVSVSDGLFNVLLGSVSDIDPSCLVGDVYLGVKVGNDSEMTPRELLASVPFAVQSQGVSGIIKGQYGGGKTGGSSSFSERYHVGSLRYSSNAVYEKLFVTVWGGGWGNGTLGKDFYSISSRGGLKVTRTRLFGSTSHYSLKIYDNGTDYDVVIEVEPSFPSVVIRSQKMASPDAILEQDVASGYDPTGKTDVTPPIENHIVTDNNGNVGIGTTDPDGKLNVNGALHVEGGGSHGGVPLAKFGTFIDVDTNNSNRVELRGSNGAYIDFSNDTASDYDVRLRLAGDDALALEGGNFDLFGTLDMHGNSITNLSSGFKAPDADKLDGKDSGDFASTNHNHDGRYYTESESDSRFVNASGDTMSGALTAGILKVPAGGSRFIEVGYDSDGSSGYLHAPGRNLFLATGWGQSLELQGGSSGIKFNIQTTADNESTKMFIGSNGKVGIGTTNPGAKLDVAGNLKLSGGGRSIYGGADNRLNIYNNTDATNSRAWIELWGNAGGRTGELTIAGKYINFVHGSNDAGMGSVGMTLTADGDLDMHGNSILSCGALVEANLQTPEELASEQVDRFEEGDVLCWGDDQLEKCDISDDPLVQAVANKNGKPVIIGAEVIKVLGPVKRGDLLVASSVPGYAMVNNEPAPGAVIAQALEGFAGEKGTIKAMIRKF